MSKSDCPIDIRLAVVQPIRLSSDQCTTKYRLIPQLTMLRNAYTIPPKTKRCCVFKYLYAVRKKVNKCANESSIIYWNTMEFAGAIKTVKRVRCAENACLFTSIEPILPDTSVYQHNSPYVCSSSAIWAHRFFLSNCFDLIAARIVNNKIANSNRFFM